MGVLTHKEYKEFSKKLKENETKQKVPEKVEEIVSPKPLEPSKEFTYCLLHPENPMELGLNFEDEITLEGKPYIRKCVNGIIKTKEKVLSNFLISKGYILMDTIKEEEESLNE